MLLLQLLPLQQQQPLRLLAVQQERRVRGSCQQQMLLLPLHA
jgi:hypothetical protein